MMSFPYVMLDADEFRLSSHSKRTRQRRIYEASSCATTIFHRGRWNVTSSKLDADLLRHPSRQRIVLATIEFYPASLRIVMTVGLR